MKNETRPSAHKKRLAPPRQVLVFPQEVRMLRFSPSPLQRRFIKEADYAAFRTLPPQPN